MNFLDVLIITPLGVGFVLGYFKGFVKELSSLVAIFIGIYAARIFASIVCDVLVKSCHVSPSLAMPFSYIVLFVGFCVLLLMVSRWLEKLLESLSLGGLNKLMGGVVGALKYGLIASVVLIFLAAIDAHFPVLSATTRTQSLLYQPMQKLAPSLWDARKLYKD